jgi:hypothetical protein
VISTHGATKGHSDEIQTWSDRELGWEIPSENIKFLSKNMVYKKACIERPIILRNWSLRILITRQTASKTLNLYLPKVPLTLLPLFCHFKKTFKKLAAGCIPISYSFL